MAIKIRKIGIDEYKKNIGEETKLDSQSINSSSIVNKKGEGEIYNDGNKKFYSKEDTQKVENYTFSKDEDKEIYLKGNQTLEDAMSIGTVTISQVNPEENYNYGMINKSFYKNSKDATTTSHGFIKNESIDVELKKDSRIEEETKNIGTVVQHMHSPESYTTKDDEGNVLEEGLTYVSGDKEITGDKGQNLSDYFNDAVPLAAQKDIIKSEIDGGTNIGNFSLTNVQDKNLSQMGFGEFGLDLAKQAGGVVTNMFGLSTSDISNVWNSIGGLLEDPKKTSFSKLEELKHEKYKELHPFDWKPGQTLPPDIVGNSVMKLADDITSFIPMSGAAKQKIGNIATTIKEVVSPDVIKQVRDTMQLNKGIGGGEISPETFTVQEPAFTAVKVSGKDSDTVVTSWQKNGKILTGFNKSDAEIRYINALKNKNSFNKTLGYIYIRPNYEYNNNYSRDTPEENAIGLGNLQIPFEFNPEIAESSVNANYVSETLMNRIGQFFVYTGTNLSQLSITLKYQSLCPDEIDDELKNSLSKQFSTDAWQYYWTNNRIEQIEYKLRSLVFPDVVSADYLIKPPLIELHFENGNGDSASTVGDLFKYPVGNENNEKFVGDKYLSTTKTIVKQGGSPLSHPSRYKKYIVTSVQIDPLNEDSFYWPSLYGRVWQNGQTGAPINHIKTAKDIYPEAEAYGYSGYTRRTGFKATLQCTEVQENFLDIVPDFKAYYDAWSKKGSVADITHDYAKIMLNDNIQESADLLRANLNASVRGISTLENRLTSKFSEAYVLASLYKMTNKKGTMLHKFNSQSENEDSDREDEDGLFYFANSQWKENGSTTISNDDDQIVTNTSKDPVLFKVALNSGIKEFYEKSFMDDNFEDELEKIYLGDETSARKYDEKLTNNKNIESKVELDKQSLYGRDVKSDPLSIKKLNDIIIKKDDNKKSFLTDRECRILKGVIEYRAKKYKDDIENLPDDNIMNDNEIKEIIESVMKNVILGKSVPTEDENTLREAMDNGEYSSKNYPKYFDIFDGSTGKITNLLSSYVSYLDKEKFQEALTNFINEQVKNNNIKFTNMPGVDKILNSYKFMEYVSEDFNSIGSRFTSMIQKLTDILISGNIKKDKVDSFLNDYAKAYYKCSSSLRNIYLYCKELVDSHFSFDKGVLKIHSAIPNAMIAGGYLNVLKSYEKKVSKSIYTFKAFEGTSAIFEKTSLDATVNNYKVVKNKNIEFLSSSYIDNKIIEALNEAKKNISKLGRELKKRSNKVGGINADAIILEIENIKFFEYGEVDDNLLIEKEEEKGFFENMFDNLFDKEGTNDENSNAEEDSDIKKDSDINEYKKISQENKNNLLKMCEAIRELKAFLSKDAIAENFYTLTGKPQDYEHKKENDVLISKLLSLDSSYEDYSRNETSLREKVFIEWDKAQSLDELSNLLKLDNVEVFSSTYNGQIPNLYYQRLKATELNREMHVAGKSLNNFNKLS